MKHNHFINLAKKASEKSDHHKYKMGCVIAKGNKVLGIGFNTNKTHPRSPHTYKSIHAEFMAWMNAGYSDIAGATAYVFRQQKDGTLAMAKPCECCWQFLVESGVSEVVYSFEGTYKKESLE